MRRRSIRSRITLLAVVVVGVVLIGTAFVLVEVQRRQLTRSIDSTLEQRARDLAAVLATADDLPRELGQSAFEAFSQLVRGDVVLASSPNLRGRAPIEGVPGSIRTRDDLAHDDDTYRVLSAEVTTLDGSAVLHLGMSLDEVNDSVGALILSLVVAIPLVAALLAGAVWWLVGRTLAPVEAIRAEVSEIGRSADLQRRVPAPATHDEIARLAATMNEMLDRLHDARQRQERFVADASHELRSPLARMRTELEVAIARAERDDALDASMLEEITALQALVEDLLHLARADAGVTEPRHELLDLDDLVFREARRVREAATVTVDTSRVSAAQVTGDAGQLARAIRNLVDNAERHASSAIALTLVERDGHAELTVADDGPGIPEAERSRVFERFARLDDARTRATGGTGLGLAISREILERHGGTIAIDPDAASGTRMIVRIPLAASG